jgi:anaerobic ribonucleoside-triphosphate reductase activating protein
MNPVPVAMLLPQTEAEGPGVRMAVWVQGCPLRCPGCCNPEMLPFDRAEGVSPRTVESLLEALDGSPAEGISLLGGEPFAHAAALAPLAEGARARGRSVMVFSGYTLAELRASGDPDVARLLACTDLLVDGPYEATRRSTRRRWIGSENQEMHFLTDRYHPDDPRFAGENHVELRLRGGVVTVSGWPTLGARRLLRGGS